MSSTPHPDELVKIGQLKKPYGIKGWLWVFSETDDRPAIFDMQPWWIKTATGLRPLTVVNWRRQGSGLVAQFEQVPDRNVAETMNGVPVWTTKEALPPVEEDEYYWADLIGLEVINEQGDYLGDIDELFETGAHDVMRVAPSSESLDSQERLIPWHKQTVISVDLAAKRVIVDWRRDY